MTGTTSGVLFETAGEDVNMRVFRGKSISFDVIWGGSSPINVTGYQASLQIRDLDGNLMLEMSTANGKVTVGGTDGKLTFTGTTTDSNSVTKPGRWELELTTPTGDVYRAVSGAVSVEPEVVT